MAKKIATKAGMMMITIQAPSENLVMPKTNMTTRVVKAPKPLTTILKIQRRSYFKVEPGSWITSSGWRCPDFHQRRAMPVWERVKERKTPIAYKGIRRVTLAWKRMISKQEIIVREPIPQE